MLIVMQYDFTEFLAYNDKADSSKCKGFVICFDFEKRLCQIFRYNI